MHQTNFKLNDETDKHDLTAVDNEVYYEDWSEGPNSICRATLCMSSWVLMILNTLDVES